MLTGTVKSVSVVKKLPRWLTVFSDHPYRTLSFLALFCALVFLGSLLIPRQDGLLVGSDGTNYYANLRSLVFDHDLNISNDLNQLTGSVSSNPIPKYSIGLPLVWLPFFLVAHVVALLLHFLGLPVTPDGYGWTYQIAVCLGTMVYFWIGLLIVFRLCRDYFNSMIALLATVLIWFGWNIIYYMVCENSMSHGASLAAVAGIIGWWRWQSRDKILRYWGGLGILIALAAMIRPQDGLFGVLPALDLLLLAIGAIRKRQWPNLIRLFATGLVTLICFLIAYTPQFATSYVAYGRIFSNGYSEAGESFNWTNPQTLAVLFSTRHGLITWHFVIFFALAGLYFLGKLDLFLTLKLTLCLILQIYVVSAWQTWWEGDAFGARMLINCAPIFALGLAAFLDFLHKRVGLWSIYTLVILAFGWNFLFLIQYRFGFIGMNDELSLKQLFLDKFTIWIDFATHGFKFHPKTGN